MATPVSQLLPKRAGQEGLPSRFWTLSGKDQSLSTPRSATEVSTSQQLLQWQQFQNWWVFVLQNHVGGQLTVPHAQGAEAEQGQEGVLGMHRTEQTHPVPVHPQPSSGLEAGGPCQLPQGF